MNRIVTAGLIFLATTNASANGLYSSYILESPPGCYTQDHNSDTRREDQSYEAVVLSYTAKKNRLSVSLTRRSSVLVTQNYICDGKEHTGDGDNTGENYTARCGSDLIEIRRVFKQLTLPMIVKYQKTTRGLDMVETFEGLTFKRQCSFIPVKSSYFR